LGHSEQLYNGVCLPERWPPELENGESREPTAVPYLESPPAVIPIDVGRQLFVDDFLIESTTLTRRFHAAELHETNPVLRPEAEMELNGGECPTASPFNDGAWYDPEDGLFKLWYLAGWFDGTGHAISQDGIAWERPELGVVPGTNRILAPRPRYHRDGCVVWLDHEAADPEQRFKMFQYFRWDGGEGGEAYTSPDGVHWSDPVPTRSCGDNSSFFYNPFRKKWVFSIRRGWPVRLRSYQEHSDFLAALTLHDGEPALWARADRLDVPDPEIGCETQLYDVNAAAYESLMIGLFAIFYGPPNEKCAKLGKPKTNDLMLAFSRDGFHWHRPHREAFIRCSREEGTWNRAYLHATGGICLVVGDRLHFYYGAWSGESPKLAGSAMGSYRTANAMYAGGSTGLSVLRRDGFASMDGGAAGGALTTRPVTFGGRYLFVNLNAPDGELRVEVLTGEGMPFEPFTAAGCHPISVDRTLQQVTWEGGEELSSLAGKPVRFRFHLTSGRLYSFWVSPDRSGASHGYVAAGGPGFTGPVDTVGCPWSRLPHLGLPTSAGEGRPPV